MSSREKMLIQRSKDGDIYAFEELIEGYQKKVYNIALRMMNNRDDAYDVSQEVFIKVFRSISKFREQSSFSTWLYRITTNVCIDEIRKRKKVNTISIDKPIKINNDEIKVELKDEEKNTPHDEVEKKELREFLKNSINVLNENHKTMIILRDINGYSYDEISEILECSLGTVKSRINRARNALKKILISNKELLYKVDV